MMLGKNNKKLIHQWNKETIRYYSIKKLSIGVASVFVASGIAMMDSVNAHAEEAGSANFISIPAQDNSLDTQQEQLTSDTQTKAMAVELEDSALLNRTEQQIAQLGSFKESHLYQTVKADQTIHDDKKIVTTFAENDYKDYIEGYKDEVYTTEAKIKKGQKDAEGYTLSSIKAQEAIEGAYSENGEEVQANYQPGIKQEVTYTYQRYEGSFKEIHRYIERKFDFDKTSMKETIETEIKEDQAGLENQSYTTMQKPRDGYTLEEIQGKNGAIFDSSYGDNLKLRGEATQGKYIPQVKQEVTYIYEKVKQLGRFQDIHKYYVSHIDEKGQETLEYIESIETERQEGYPGEDYYSADKKEKDGYVFRGFTEPEINHNDGHVTGTYKSGEVIPVVYVYVKPAELPKENIPPVSETPEGSDSVPEGSTEDAPSMPEVPKESTPAPEEPKVEQPPVSEKPGGGDSTPEGPKVDEPSMPEAPKENMPTPEVPKAEQPPVSEKPEGGDSTPEAPKVDEPSIPEEPKENMPTPEEPKVEQPPASENPEDSDSNPEAPKEESSPSPKMPQQGAEKVEEESSSSNVSLKDNTTLPETGENSMFIPITTGALSLLLGTTVIRRRKEY